MGVYFLIGVVALLLWIFLSWRPLVPVVDAQLARIGQILGVCTDALICFGGGNELKEARMDILKRLDALKSSINKLVQDLGLKESGDFLKVFKILTSYFQVFPS
jgi:hypothetical protein